MRIVVQRVAKASLTVDGNPRGSIGRGLVALAGFASGDAAADLSYLAGKVLSLRVFEDAAGKMNLPLADVDGELMVVPQFTLYGDCRRGNRPDFTAAAPPGPARGLYEEFVRMLDGRVRRLVRGDFAASMLVEIHNDGPVTLILSSRAERDPAGRDAE